MEATKLHKSVSLATQISTPIIFDQELITKKRGLYRFHIHGQIEAGLTDGKRLAFSLFKNDVKIGAAGSVYHSISPSGEGKVLVVCADLPLVAPVRLEKGDRLTLLAYQDGETPLRVMVDLILYKLRIKE